MGSPTVVSRHTQTLLRTLLLLSFISTVTSKRTRVSQSKNIGSILKHSYTYHVDLIRLGIPSSVVTRFYNRALWEVSCAECVTRRANGRLQFRAACIRMVFRNMQSKSGKVLATRRLIHAIKLDKTRKHPFFTTFHGHKTLPPTSRGLYASINYTYSATLDTVPDDLKSDTYPHAIFPHERDIPYPHRADTTACKPLTRNNDKLLPLHTYLAYALGLAAHLHFTGIRATHIRAIVDMAARHACTCIRCERMYETQLGIPAIWFAQLSSRAQRYAPRTRPRASRRAKARKEGVEKNVGRLPKLTDVAGTVLAPRRFLSAEISALATCTQRKAGFVVTDGLSLQYRDIQSSIRMLSLEAYVETYVALSTRKLGKPGTGEGDKGDGDTGDRVQGGREPEGNVCPDGYEEMQRIGCVNHIWESCCPVACRVAGGVLMAVQVEACCEASNYYVVSIGTAGDTVYVGSDGDADDRHSIAIRI